MQPQHPQLAVSAAIFRDGKILLVRRARSPAKGFYSLPGGRVEFGETLHAALHREVDEETALKIEIVGLAGWREVVPGTTGGGHYLIMSFAARWMAGEPVLNDEHDDFKWLDPDALGDLKTTGGLQEVIQSARGILGLTTLKPRLASSALKRHITGAPDPFMSKHLLAIFLLISVCISGPARAQDAAAPFDGDLQRLAEILGTLHYLRGICGTNEGPKWRNEMQALIDAETPSGDRRARMIAGFNRGYNGFQQTYRTCTPAATVAIRRYIEEGSKISRDLTARYAN